MSAQGHCQVEVDQVFVMPHPLAPRSGHSFHAIDDGERSHLVAFGGYDGSRRRKDILHLPNYPLPGRREVGTEPASLAWRRCVAPAEVAGRAGHVAVQVGPGEIFLFGGYQSDRENLKESMLLRCLPTGDGALTFEFHPIKDEPVVKPDTADPLERRWAAGWRVGRPDDQGFQVMVHGGWNQAGKSDSLLMFSSKSNVWQYLRPLGDLPSGRRWHNALPLDEEGRTTLMYGGYDGGALADLFLFDAEATKWIKGRSSGTVPPARCRSGLLRLSSKEILCFGGYGSSSQPGASKPLSDAYILHTDDMKWAPLPSKGLFLLNRAGMSVSPFTIPGSNSFGGVCFGGFDGSQDLSQDVFHIFPSSS